MFDEYVRCLNEEIEKTHRQSCIRSILHEVYTISESKIALNSYDVRRYVVPDSTETIGSLADIFVIFYIFYIVFFLILYVYYYFNLHFMYVFLHLYIYYILLLCITIIIIYTSYMYKKIYTNQKLYRMNCITFLFSCIHELCDLSNPKHLTYTWFCLRRLSSCPEIHVRMNSAMQLVLVKYFSDRSVTHCQSIDKSVLFNKKKVIEIQSVNQSVM